MQTGGNALSKLSSTRVVFAPMVGISHYAVRAALQEFLPTDQKSLWPTEMLNSRRLPKQVEDESPELTFKDKEAGLAPQLLANELELIEKSVAKLKSFGAKAIDINMGCPVQKALKHNYGVALMGDPHYASEIVQMTVDSSDLPVSVKLRAGLQKDSDYLLQFVKGLEKAGASWLTLHPRLASEGRKGRSDWSQIRLLKENLKIPIVGNGDIECFEDISQMLEQTLCDRVMVGRALLAKPWLIRHGFQLEEPSEFEQGEMYGSFLKKVAQISIENYQPEPAMRKFKFLLYHSHVWLEYGHFLYSEVRGCTNLEEVLMSLETFFSSPQKMFKRTSRKH